MRGDGLGTFDLDLVSDPVAALKVGRDFGHNRSHRTTLLAMLDAEDAAMFPA